MVQTTRWIIVVFAFLSYWTVPCGSVQAQSDVAFNTAWPTDVADPESVVPSQEEANRRPVAFGYYLMEIARLAAQAEENGDLNRAAQFYRTMSKVAPQRAVGSRKMCQIYRIIGDVDNAKVACREVLNRDGANRADFGKWIVSLSADGAIRMNAKEIDDIRDVIMQREGDAEEKIALWQLVCESAIRIPDQQMLDICVSELETLEANDIPTITFAWHSAVAKGNTKKALEWITRAEQLGLNKDSLQRMRSVTFPQTDQENGGCSVGPRGQGSWPMLFAILTFVGSRRLIWRELKSIAGHRKRQQLGHYAKLKPLWQERCAKKRIGRMLLGYASIATMQLGCTDYDIDIEIDLATTLLEESEGQQGPVSSATSGSGETSLGSTTENTDGGSGVTTDANVDAEGELWASLHRDIMGPRCAGSGCHDSSTKAGMLDLSDPCTSQSSLLSLSGPCQKPWVTPHEPELSFLLEKIESSAPACGLRMPIGSELSLTEQQRIRNWIVQGAPGCVVHE